MSRIALSPLLIPGKSTVQNYATVTAWLYGTRPVDGIVQTLEPGMGAFVDLPAPGINQAWNIGLKAPGVSLLRLVSFSGEFVGWSELYDIDPSTLTALPQDGALAEWQAVLKELEDYSKSPGPKGDKGDRGEKGDTGAQGIQGITGLTGDQGPQGITGNKGDKGDQGLPGATGPAGPQGNTGATGTQGLTGTSGPVGPAGPQGIKGDIGPAGPQGIKGDIGPAGPQGIKGDTGATGAASTVVGPTGPQGPQGIQGATGAQGPAGADWTHTDTTTNSVSTTATQISPLYNGTHNLVHVRAYTANYDKSWLLSIYKNPYNQALGYVTVLATVSVVNNSGYTDPTWGFNASGYLTATFPNSPGTITTIVRVTRTGV